MQVPCISAEICGEIFLKFNSAFERIFFPSNAAKKRINSVNSAAEKQMLDKMSNGKQVLGFYKFSTSKSCILSITTTSFHTPSAPCAAIILGNGLNVQYLVFSEET